MRKYIFFLIGLIISLVTLCLIFPSYKRSKNEKLACLILFDVYLMENLYFDQTGKYTQDPKIVHPVNHHQKDGKADRIVIKETQEQKNKRFAGIYEGYLLKVTATADETNQNRFFTAWMVPKIATGFYRTGDDCFYIDQTGIIRHSGSPTKIPDASSPPVE